MCLVILLKHIHEIVSSVFFFKIKIIVQPIETCESLKFVKDGCVLGGVGDFDAPKTGYIVVSRLGSQYKVLKKVLLIDFESFSWNSP